MRWRGDHGPSSSTSRQLGIEGYGIEAAPRPPLAPAPASKDHFTLKSEYDLFIGGKWVKPKSGKYFDTINPANEQKLAHKAPLVNSAGCDRVRRSFGLRPS